MVASCYKFHAFTHMVKSVMVGFGDCLSSLSYPEDSSVITGLVQPETMSGFFILSGLVWKVWIFEKC